MQRAKIQSYIHACCLELLLGHRDAEWKEDQRRRHDSQRVFISHQWTLISNSLAIKISTFNSILILYCMILWSWLFEKLILRELIYWELTSCRVDLVRIDSWELISWKLISCEASLNPRPIRLQLNARSPPRPGIDCIWACAVVAQVFAQNERISEQGGANRNTNSVCKHTYVLRKITVQSQRTPCHRSIL